MKRFPAKVLLFGEYGLLYGAKALTLPFHRFGGGLDFDEDALITGTKKYESLLEIDRFVSYFSHQGLNEQMNFPLDFDKLKTDLKKGLYFNSDIPLQYGVGSSGALCAAIFDEYSFYHQNFKSLVEKKDLLEALKHDFAVLESYFHGTSSGLDPLVSFLDRPVLLERGKISLPRFSMNDLAVSISLIDTHQVGPTGPLVGLFTNRMKDSAFETWFCNEYLPLNNQLVDAFLAGKFNQMWEAFPKFVQFQKQHFKEMIPEEFISAMDEMLSRGVFLKLLGSGGGGFLLAFAPDGKSPKSDFPMLKLVS